MILQPFCCCQAGTRLQCDKRLAHVEAAGGSLGKSVVAVLLVVGQRKGRALRCIRVSGIVSFGQ